MCEIGNESPWDKSKSKGKSKERQVFYELAARAFYLKANLRIKDTDKILLGEVFTIKISLNLGQQH